MNGATVKVYSLRKDGDKKISTNFRVKEFRCQDGSDPVFIGAEVLGVLQKVRNHFGKPVVVDKHSAYRTPTHNKKVGGEAFSYHMYALAVDFHVDGVAHKTVYDYLNKTYPNKYGIGLYSWGIHVDTRSAKSRWQG